MSAIALSLLALGAPPCLAACSRPPPVAPDAGPGAAQQAIVDRAASALDALRSDPKLAGMEHFLGKAKATLIFPRLIKASMIFGGEGGNGVMMLRAADGGWRGPAFYSLGAASAGFQFGYQEAAVVFFLMTDSAVERLLEQGLVLGTDASVALGPMGEEHGTAVTDTLTAEIYQFSMVGGAYAGVAFDGAVIKERPKHQRAYYGQELTARAVLKDGSAPARVNDALMEALRPRPAAQRAPAPAAPQPGGSTPLPGGTPGPTAAPDSRTTPDAPAAPDSAITAE